MTAAGLRRRVLQLTGLACAGLAAELLLIGHDHSLTQWTALVLCCIGATIAVLALHNRAHRLVRWGPYSLLIGAVWGMWQHFEHNYLFAAEIQPTASRVAHMFAALTGASPLLAPGGLGLLGALLWLCTREPLEG